MKLELLDAYNIRARLSASIILLAPVAVTIFFCCEEIITLASSSILIGIMLAFTNYIPILQRSFYKDTRYLKNYAADFLHPDDKTINSISKTRYYHTFAKIDDSFSAFYAPENKESFHNCCKSAVIYLRNHTRNNRLVQEENITYGFYKNLFGTKALGISFTILCDSFLAIYGWKQFDTFSEIPLQYSFAFVLNLLILAFWIFCVNEKTLRDVATRYAKVLLAATDALDDQ